MLAGIWQTKEKYFVPIYLFFTSGPRMRRSGNLQSDDTYLSKQMNTVMEF